MPTESKAVRELKETIKEPLFTKGRRFAAEDIVRKCAAVCLEFGDDVSAEYLLSVLEDSDAD